MATPEAQASQVVRLRAAAWGCKVFRNNSGVLMNDVGVPVRFGLGNESKQVNQNFKSSDLIGWTPVTITPDMVGKQLAVFTSIEAKALGFKEKENYTLRQREYAQKKWLDLVTNAGGIAGFACCEADVDKIIQEFLKCANCKS